MAPNMATTCCSPTTTVAPAGSRSSGMTTPSVLRLQRGKKLFSAGMIVPFFGAWRSLAFVPDPPPEAPDPHSRFDRQAN